MFVCFEGRRPNGKTSASHLAFSQTEDSLEPKVFSVFWTLSPLFSPHATAELVEELKQGREEPDASKAATLGVDIIDEYNVEKYNPQIKELVSKLPGINSKNIYGLLNKGVSLAEMASCPRSSLEETVGGEVAGLALYNALHTPINLPDPAEAAARKKPPGKQGRFKTRK